jgi:hypothetical protein
MQIILLNIDERNCILPLFQGGEFHSRCWFSMIYCIVLYSQLTLMYLMQACLLMVIFGIVILIVIVVLAA